MYYNPRAADVNQGGPPPKKAALRRPPLGGRGGRLGRMEKPPHDKRRGGDAQSVPARFVPHLRCPGPPPKKAALRRPPLKGRGGRLGQLGQPRPLRSGAPFARRNRKPHAAFFGGARGGLSFPRKKGPLAKKEKIYFVSLSYAFFTPHFQHSSIPATAPTAACRIWYGSLRMAYSGVL